MPTPELGECLGIVALPGKCLAEVAVGLGVVGLQADRGAVLGDGLVGLPLHP